MPGSSAFVLSLKRMTKRLPSLLQRFLRHSHTYINRLLRWYPILRDVRGETVRDELILATSAFASPWTSLRRLELWQDPVLLCDANVRVDRVGRFSLRHHSDDLWHVVPQRERMVLRFIEKHLKPGDTFVDAGANIGFYTILAGQLVGIEGQIFSVEMLEGTAKILRRHIELNRLDNVTVVQRALSEKSGEYVIARAQPGRSGLASIVSTATPQGLEFKIETTTLDTILAGVDKVSLMKMDLEGAEELALAGAKGILPRIKAIVFEDWGDTRLMKVFQLRGFTVQRLDDNNCLAINT